VAFLEVLAALAAAVLVCAAVIVIRVRSRRRWARTAALVGVLVLAAGIALFVVFAGIALNRYDEQANPAWLDAVGKVALLLAAGGLAAILSAAIGSARRKD
jgi:NADH:ubiquinone oxidoreductase subunit 4 (subunit M)